MKASRFIGIGLIALVAACGGGDDFATLSGNAPLIIGHRAWRHQRCTGSARSVVSRAGRPPGDAVRGQPHD